mgnify:CR=1 FL=1
MAGLTERGLVIRTLDEEREQLKQRARVIFSDQVEAGDVVNTDDKNSALGRMIGVAAPSYSDLWEAVQQVYDAFNPEAALGKSQDDLYLIGGVTRDDDAPTISDCYVEGNINTIIPQGSVVSSSSTTKSFSTKTEVVLASERCIGVGVAITEVESTAQYTIYYRASSQSTYTPITVVSASVTSIEDIMNALYQEVSSKHRSLIAERKDGRLFVKARTNFQLYDFYTSPTLAINKSIMTVRVECTEDGPFQQPAGSINTISTPVFGWDSITNPLAATVGKYRETDEQFREKFRNSKFQKASNILESLMSKLNDVDGINNYKVYENDTDVVDDIGLPPHSFLVLVDGGNDLDIAKTIWNNKPTGIKPQGNVSIDVIDKQGFVRPIQFSRPVEVNVFVTVRLSTDAYFPENGQELVKQAVYDYINSFQIEQDIIYSRLYTPINSVKGHQVDELLIGRSLESLTSSNIEIDYDEIAKISLDNIIVS